MHLTQVNIFNFKCFESFELPLENWVNILVWDNEAWKSTILEAINLGLTWWLNWQHISKCVAQSLFNKKTIHDFLRSGWAIPPEIIIELYFETDDEAIKATFEWLGNESRLKKCWVQFRVKVRDQYLDEFMEIVQSWDEHQSLPVEFYEYFRKTFGNDTWINPKWLPIKAALIDATHARYRNWGDIYMSRIIRDKLSEEEKLWLSKIHRNLRDNFNWDEVVKDINNWISSAWVSWKSIELSLDLWNRNAWETSLRTYIDGVPFHQAWKWEQCFIKTELALSHKKTDEANIVLVEEPENHLSHSRLNQLTKYIHENSEWKQVVITTHSSFVSNKLWISNLVLLGVDWDWNRNHIKFDKIDKDTQNYFMKLAGYNTLRLVLSNSCLLVEWPSEELMVQRAFKDQDKNDRLPIEKWIDIISVAWLAFKRYLDLSVPLKKKVAVITDNDGDYEVKIIDKYVDYIWHDFIEICANKDEELHTLEFCIVEANKSDLDNLRKVLWIKKKKYSNKEDIIKYMVNNKTKSALRIFDAVEKILYPRYILDAIDFVNA